MSKLISALILLSAFTISYSQTLLPTAGSSLFAGSGKCLACHLTNKTGVLTVNGEELTPANHWRSSMMANASKDPLWRAVVSEETSKFPELAKTIETTCTRCHAPMGNKQAFHDGADGYSIKETELSKLGRDGVSCTVCHQIQPANLGTPESFSGGFEIKPEKVVFGPYEDPLVDPMTGVAGYEPRHSQHINESALCGTCHTLFTPYLNNKNEIAGMFPEQTPYLEWKNSKFPAANANCQSCHMPPLTDSVDISTTPPWHKVKRSPFWRHLFIGSNAFMGKLLGNNFDTLNLTATPAHFDSTVKKTKAMLMEKTVALEISPSQSGDLLSAKVKVSNLTGHKLPTGIPYRRVWIKLNVKDEAGNTVFESGGWDDEGEITGNTGPFVPHYNEITSPGQVQIYEGVLQDVDENVTFTLLRAAGYKKDNRLPPQGFTTKHVSYDSIKIYGEALSDPDFNRDGSAEGTGSDFITYKIKLKDKGTYSITAEAVYQSVPPGLVHHLAEIDTPEIKEFIRLYDNESNAPVIMNSVTKEIKISSLK